MAGVGVCPAAGVDRCDVCRAVTDRGADHVSVGGPGEAAGGRVRRGGGGGRVHGAGGGGGDGLRRDGAGGGGGRRRDGVPSQAAVPDHDAFYLFLKVNST